MGYNKGDLLIMKDVTNIYQKPPTTVCSWMDVLGAVILAAGVGLPFAIYFYLWISN
jgi:hypothetical protein